MKRVFRSLLVVFCLMAGLCPASSLNAQEHLRVGDISLARPYSEVVRGLQSKGFVQKASAEEGTLWVGRFWDVAPAAAVPMQTGDSCHMLMMILPEPAGGDQALFSLYNRIRARVTEVYGVYGREENVFIDENVNDFSPLSARIAAVRYGMAILFTQFQLLEGSIDVSVNRHDATGLGVFVIFRDRDYVDPDAPSQVMIIEENQALEPTRVKGVDINRRAADVVRDLQARGLREDGSMLDRWFYRKNHLTRLYGEFFSVPGCEVLVQGEPEVDLVHLRFPSTASWQQLYGLYTSVREALAVKYGSIYRNDDEIAGRTSDLLSIDERTAMQSIRQGNAHLQTLLLNRYDGHAMKVVITCQPNDGRGRVELIYYTPQGLHKRMSPTP